VARFRSIGHSRFRMERAELQEYPFAGKQKAFFRTLEDERALDAVVFDESIRLKDAIAGLSFSQAMEASCPSLLLARQQ